MSSREISDAKNGITSRKEYGFRDPVVRNVVDKFVSRSDVGFEKYGSTLDDERRLKMKGLTKYLNDIQEELMDAVLYIQAAREELQDLSEEALIERHRNDKYEDNHDIYAEYGTEQDQYNGQTRSGGLFSDNVKEMAINRDINDFDLIRIWANDRGLYNGGDPKTQALKLVEEVGETCRAILKEDAKEIVDGIGDCVVVLVNLAELTGTPIEECINAAYNEIKNRTGKMNNGTFKKD